MTLATRPLSAEVSVTGQLEPSSMAEAAAAGFRSVINNRPDFEGGPTQPTSANLEAAAIAAGLRYEWLPVLPAMQSADEIARFATLLGAMPKPILAFCRTGTRSGHLVRAASGS